MSAWAKERSPDDNKNLKTFFTGTKDNGKYKTTSPFEP